MERDERRSIILPVVHDFNSHAHVERDVLNLGLTNAQNISTHTLTWSVTIKETAETAIREISTHTLTWSVTQNEYIMIMCSEHFNSHAHVERDVFMVSKNHNFVDFNSHAHVERDVLRI